KNEGDFLCETARKVVAGGTIVEIGSWKGKSTVCLGRGSQDGQKARIYAIDPHVGSSEHQRMFGQVDTFQEFKNNIAEGGVSGLIEPIRDSSENAAKNFTKPVNFVFIDGAHEYEFVGLDFRLWFPKLIDSGLVAFHDTWHFIGPNLATAGALLFSSQIRNPRLIDTITVFQKTKRNSFSDRCRNIGFLLYRTLFGWIGIWRLSRQSRKTGLL
ncbi:MAG: class I SAM-dependent methyltransferase, partial [bacterium]|nr:class I SAM-dependent methyltransferase [bacterium]